MPPKLPTEVEGRPTRGDVHRLGDYSARVARQLMSLSNTDFENLPLDEKVRRDVDQARRITSPSARRREERRLAGILRAEGLAEIETMLEAQHQEQRQGARDFQLVEKIRLKVLDGDDGAIAILVGDPSVAPWPTIVDEARREDATGKPKGAKKRLFRALATARADQVAAANVLKKTAASDAADDGTDDTN